MYPYARRHRLARFPEMALSARLLALGAVGKADPGRVALAFHEDALRELRRKIVLDLKRRVDTAVRLGMGVSEGRALPLPDLHGDSIGDLVCDPFLVLVQHLAKSGIDGQSLDHRM